MIFHINACSLNKNFDVLDHLLKSTNKVFDIIAVSETIDTKETSLTTNTNLKSCTIEFTCTESSAAATLLYNSSHLSYKPHPDLNILIFIKLTSYKYTFVEIINPEKINIVIG